MISFNNIYYVVRKTTNRRTARRSRRLLRAVFKPVPLDGQILYQAIDSDFGDFEDALQFHSAIRSGADYLVTRDADDFPDAGLSNLSPAEFLATVALD